MSSNASKAESSGVDGESGSFSEERKSIAHNEDDSKPSSPGEKPLFDPDQTDCEQAFEITRHGCFNRLATTCCCLIFIHALIEMVAIAYVITPAECDLNLTVGQKSAVNSAVFLGIMVTAIGWGMLGDSYGRKRVMLPALLSSILASFISSLCTTFLPMLIMRFLTGVLVSASSAMVLVYLSELHLDDHRDTHISIVMASAQFSFSLITCVAWAIIPGTWTINLGFIIIRSWRVFMWLWGCVGLSGAIILMLLPESPRFIVAKKGPEKALPILAKMYAWNNSTTADKYPVKHIDESTVPHQEQVTLRKDLAELFKVPMRKCVYLSHGAMFVTFMLTNGFYIWLPDLLNSALSHKSEALSMCGLLTHRYSDVKAHIDDNIPVFPVKPLLGYTINAMTEVKESEINEFSNEFSTPDCSEASINTMMYPLTLGMETFYLIPFLAIIFCINKFRKPRLYAFVMWCCAVGLVLCSFLPQMMVAFCCLVVGLASGSCCSILTAMAVDVFPTKLRGLATCTMFMVGQLGAVVGTSIIGLMGGWTCYLIFMLMAGVVAGSAFLLIFMWPDPEKVRNEMSAKGFSY